VSATVAFPPGAVFLGATGSLAGRGAPWSVFLASFFVWHAVIATAIANHVTRVMRER